MKTSEEWLKRKYNNRDEHIIIIIILHIILTEL